MMDREELRKCILDEIDDEVMMLLFYDRKEDLELPLRAIETAVHDGIITVDEMVEQFRTSLIEGMKK